MSPWLNGIVCVAMLGRPNSLCNDAARQHDTDSGEGNLPPAVVTSSHILDTL